jgi:predicted phosphodiesterase
MELFYQAMAAQLPDAGIIVFGHFHAPVVKYWDNRLFVNPGAVVPTHGRSTFALLELGTEVKAQIVELADRI